jgi:hypothetical protein
MEGWPMWRIGIRDAVWMALLGVVLFAWYLEYRSDALARHRDAQAIQYLKQQLSEKPPEQIVTIRLPDDWRPPSELRPVPGNSDFQFPPELPVRLEPDPLIPWRFLP